MNRKKATKQNQRVTAIIISVVLFMGAFISSCGLSTENDYPLQILAKTNSITLEWDPPNVPDTSPKSPASYWIYYRNRGQVSWTFLAAVPASDHPSYTITEQILNYGIYEFAVSVVDTTDTESTKHTSLDRDARPVTGWYVNWIGSQ